jgi:2-polyprenyl-3-methyl-5-hydroxy-6-metoxy-1,4-benzoquinol methylase
MMYDAPAKMINSSKSAIIDIGCSNGYGYYKLVEEDAVSRYLGIDLHEGGIADLNEIIEDRKNHKAVVADWLTIPEKDLFVANYMLCIEVIEHIKKDDRIPFLKKCAKHLKSDGNLFLSTPPGRHEGIHHYGLLRPDECVALLNSAGFSAVAMQAQWTNLFICSPF